MVALIVLLSTIETTVTRMWSPEVSRSRVDLIWNKGIARLCDWRIPDEFPDGINYSHVPTLAGALISRRLPDDLIQDPFVYSAIRSGQIVWVRLSWLKSFIRQVLPSVEAKFILITADSDSCVPSEVRREAGAILESPKILHWYAQNYDASTTSKKISPAPIGIDFHMLSERAIWGEPNCSPAEQEHDLLVIQKSLPPLRDRIPKVYVDFAGQPQPRLNSHRLLHPLKGTSFRESRRKVLRSLSKNDLVFFQTGPLPRREMWRKRGEYVFVLSPHGMGLDCHRTWEALALGHIVLAPSSSLDVLYSGLPVIPLNSWSDITAENLRSWIAQYPEGAGDSEKLKTSYWIKQMRSCCEHSSGLETETSLEMCD